MRLLLALTRQRATALCSMNGVRFSPVCEEPVMMGVRGGNKVLLGCQTCSKASTQVHMQDLQLSARHRSIQRDGCLVVCPVRVSSRASGYTALGEPTAVWHMLCQDNFKSKCLGRVGGDSDST